MLYTWNSYKVTCHYASIFKSPKFNTNLRKYSNVDQNIRKGQPKNNLIFFHFEN